MNLYEAIEIICKDYCKYPDTESGNRLADICDKCPMNKCEDLRWADRKDKPTISKMEQVEDEPQTDTEIAKAIVHKMIDDAVIAEDAYPDLRQKMHDAVDEYESQTDCPWK